MTRLQEMMASHGYLSAMEVANRVGWNITTVYRKHDSRELLCVQVGAKWFVNAASLERHLGSTAGMLLKGVEIPAEARQWADAFAKDAEGTLLKLAEHHAAGATGLTPAAPKRKVRAQYKNKVPYQAAPKSRAR